MQMEVSEDNSSDSHPPNSSSTPQVIASSWYIHKSPHNSPPLERAYHTASTIGRFLYIFGGIGKNGVYLNNLAIFDLEEMCWIDSPIIGTPPSPRCHHAAALVGRRIFISGGEGPGGKKFSDVHVFDTSHRSWHTLPSSLSISHLQIFQERESHVMVSVGDKLLVYGGSDLAKRKRKQMKSSVDWQSTIESHGEGREGFDGEEGSVDSENEISPFEVICSFDVSHLTLPPPTYEGDNEREDGRQTGRRHCIIS
jgi:hypothetical protein